MDWNVKKLRSKVQFIFIVAMEKFDVKNISNEKHQ